MNSVAAPTIPSAVVHGDCLGRVRITGHYELTDPLRQSTVWLSSGFEGWLADEGVSLAFSACDFGALHLLGLDRDGRIELAQYGIDHSTGICVQGDDLLLGTRKRLIRFRRDLLAGDRAVYQPVATFHPGPLDVHEVAVDREGRVLLVASAQSSLMSLRRDKGANPVWTPWFITDLRQEDRCHLNGLCLDSGGVPAYMTAFCESDEPAGWRSIPSDSGVLMSLRENRTVLRGLVRPHSPRLHGGSVLFLDSGRGLLRRFQPDTGRLDDVLFLPGFLRGLSFHGDYVAITSSLPRHDRYDLPLDGELASRAVSAVSGLFIVHLESARVCHRLEFITGIREMFDVAFLPRLRQVGFRAGPIED